MCRGSQSRPTSRLLFVTSIRGVSNSRDRLSRHTATLDPFHITEFMGNLINLTPPVSSCPSFRRRAVSNPRISNHAFLVVFFDSAITRGSRDDNYVTGKCWRCSPEGRWWSALEVYSRNPIILRRSASEIEPRAPGPVAGIHTSCRSLGMALLIMPYMARELVVLYGKNKGKLRVQL